MCKSSVAKILFLTASTIFSTGAAQYIVEPAPLELNSSEIYSYSEKVATDGLVVSYHVSGQPVAQLSNDFEIEIAGRKYFLHSGSQIKPYFVLMSGASKVVPENTKVYCAERENLSADQRGGTAGLGSRYSMAVQLCLVPSADQRQFVRAFLNGAKASVDRVPLEISQPIRYVLRKDETAPDRLMLVYVASKSGGGRFEIRIGKGDSTASVERPRPEQSAYIVVRPRIADLYWNGYDRNSKSYPSESIIYPATRLPKVLPFLDGELLVKNNLPGSGEVSVQIVRAPVSGLFRTVYLSTRPTVIYLTH